MGNGNKNKSIEEKLSDTISSSNPSAVEQLPNQEEDTNVTGPVLKEALDRVKKRIENLKAGEKKRDQENRLKRIIELLETKLKSIDGAVPSVDNSAATGSQAAPAARSKESEEDQRNSPLSRSSIGGSNGSASSFVKLPESSNGEYIKVPSGSGSDSSFEEVGEDGNVSMLFPEDDNKNLQPVPLVLAPELIFPLNIKKFEQVNNTTPQNTKGSDLHIIATSTLAVAGVALGVAIAVHLEMLSARILVGACCLVAAAVMCHYEWPSSFIENNQIEKVVLDEEKGPTATPV